MVKPHCSNFRNITAVFLGGQILVFFYCNSSLISRKLGPKLVNDKGQLDKEFEQLSSRVRKIYNAVLDGDMLKAKEELPAHYKYLEDVSVLPIFVKRAILSHSSKGLLFLLLK